MSGIALRPSYWASVSGGKDSLYMLKLILSKPWKYPLDGVVHFELEIDYPFIKDVIDYMERECKKHGIPFVRIKPRVSYYDLLKKRGFPSRKVRWCNAPYKLDAKKQLKEYLQSINCELISYIGYCVDEENRYKKRAGNKEVYPLVEENIEENSILEWAKTVPVFNDFYKFNRRCGCMYCPMMPRKEMAYLLKYYPKNYDFLMSAAKETEKMLLVKTGKKCSVWGGNAKYDTDYIDKIVREKYIPILEEKLNPTQTTLFEEDEE